MFSSLKSFFGFTATTTEKEENMFSIKELDGKFAIVDRHGTLAAGPYSRRRDAFRGAERRGFQVA